LDNDQSNLNTKYGSVWFCKLVQYILQFIYTASQSAVYDQVTDRPITVIQSKKCSWPTYILSSLEYLVPVSQNIIIYIIHFPDNILSDHKYFVSKIITRKNEYHILFISQKVVVVVVVKSTYIALL